MKIDLIVGARPNFMKIAPIIDAINQSKLEGYDIEYRLIHTGQHYDKNMSGDFFEQLNIPLPEINFEIGSGTQAEQTGKIMVRYENLLLDKKPDYCLVVGDVTSTMACAIVAKKLCIKVIHVEGGIRSWDLSMPEEINRIVTDSITDYFFTTSKTASNNLVISGISNKRIFFVGNTMIDTLLKHRQKFKKPILWNKLKLKKKNFIILTLHRPSNVDESLTLNNIINEIVTHSRGIPIIFPVHPRTAKKIDSLSIDYENLYFVEPLNYLEFNFLVEKAKVVLTDSGGITEETTVMNVPCMTLRNSTERPETVELGTNELLGDNPKNISKAFDKLFANQWKKGSIPHFWDGKSAKRIVKHLFDIPN